MTDTHVSLWVLDDFIYVSFPSLTGGFHKQTCRFPNDLDGLQALLRTLNHRTLTSRLGTPGDPTQHHVDKLIKEFKGPIKRTRKPSKWASSANEVLRTLGMIK